MPKLSACITRVLIVHPAYTRHMADTRPLKNAWHLSSNKTIQLGAFPLNLFLFCALLTNSTCLHMHYTGTKHVYNAMKGHVAYIAHSRVLCTALKHIMSARMPLSIYIPSSQNLSSIPMSTSDFSYMYRCKKDLRVRRFYVLCPF
jgi:hypothetical protein